jgi:hypothetical protein
MRRQGARLIVRRHSDDNLEQSPGDCAEATLFFIVFDVMVGAVALFSPRRWWRAATAALIGALIGASVLAAVTWIRGEPMRFPLVLTLP